MIGLTSYLFLPDRRTKALTLTNIHRSFFAFPKSEYFQRVKIVFSLGRFVSNVCLLGGIGKPLGWGKNSPNEYSRIQSRKPSALILLPRPVRRGEGWGEGILSIVGSRGRRFPPSVMVSRCAAGLGTPKRTVILRDSDLLPILRLPLSKPARIIPTMV